MMRGRAVAARQVHTLEVGGSSPSPATTITTNNMKDEYQEKDYEDYENEASGCGTILTILLFITLFWLCVGAFFLFTK